MKLAWTDADLEDVWNNGVDAGRAQERARVIAVLEEHEAAITNPFNDPEWPGLVRAIALMKAGQE